MSRRKVKTGALPILKLRRRQVRGIFFRIVFAVWLFSTAHGLSAEVIASSQYQFAIDLPEGFVLSDTDGMGTAYEFTHLVLPVQTVLRLYENTRYTSAQSALTDAVYKLSGRAEVTSFAWRGSQAAITQFIIEPFPSRREYGWAIAVPIPAANSILVALAYTPEEASGTFDTILLSILDSVYTDRGSYFTAGPVTAFAYPPAGEQQIELAVNGMNVPTRIDSGDAEANQFVIDREFSILKLFFTTEALQPFLEDAYARYYRLIFRDGYGRIKQAAFDISVAFEAQLAADGAADETDRERAILTALLSWVQHMEYGRDLSASDFTPLPLTLQGAASDCDGRVLLLAALLTQMNFKTALFVSPEKGHALLGVQSDLPGFRFEVDGAEYLMCETIENVTPGLIPQNMSDPNMWIVVPF